MNKKSLPSLNAKPSKSTILIPLIIIIVFFHLVLLYIYLSHKNDSEQGADKAVTLTKVEDESYSDTPVQNRLIEPINLELAEDSTETKTDTSAVSENANANTEDSSLPALMSKSETQIEGNPKFQTLFPSYDETINNQAIDNNEQNVTTDIPPTFNDNQPLDNMQTDISDFPEEDNTEEMEKIADKKAITKAKAVKKVKKQHRPKKQPPIFDEPTPMYPPVYQAPEPQVTEQDIKDSALLSADLPKAQRPQLAINNLANDKLQKMEQAKEKNDKLQEQLSNSIQSVRAINERKIEQEKQLARRAYEDSLAVQEMKNQLRQKEAQQMPTKQAEPTKQDKKQQP